MTKVKRRTVLSKENITFSLKKFGFYICEYIVDKNNIRVYVCKDYSKSFNIEFDGIIVLEIIINPQLEKQVNITTYPVFKEISDKIPKKAFYHINMDGSICYAPPKRPLEENWQFEDFVNAVDALLYNYFSVEYIGTGELFELEHGTLGLKQYEVLSKIRKD